MTYMAPEMFHGQPYGVKSDIWALGCVLYHLCALQAPYDASNPGELVVKVISQTHRPIPVKYSSKLHALVDWLLVKDPDERPDVVGILRSDLMAEHLTGEGYEPRLIGALTDKLKLDIELRAKELDGIEDAAERRQTECELAALRRNLDLSYTQVPMKHDFDRALLEQQSCTWTDCLTKNGKEYHVGYQDAGGKWLGPGVHIWIKGAFYEGSYLNG